MVKAIVSHGQVRPLEPLPADWHESQSLRIDRDESDTTVESINRDFTLLDQLCATNDPKNEQQLLPLRDSTPCTLVGQCG